MGKRGPHPAPTHLKVLEGVKEYRLNRDEPTPADSGVVPPVPLSERAQAVWDRLAPDLIDKNVLTAWDVDMFSTFCNAVAIYHENMDLMAGQYVARGSGDGVIKSPHWQIMRDCEQIMSRIGGRFGLTPGDRAALKVGGSEESALGADRLLS